MTGFRLLRRHHAAQLPPRPARLSYRLAGNPGVQSTADALVEAFAVAIATFAAAWFAAALVMGAAHG